MATTYSSWKRIGNVSSACTTFVLISELFDEELEEKVENLELKIQQIEQDFYFDMRNKQMEIMVLKNKLREASSE